MYRYVSFFSLILLLSAFLLYLIFQREYHWQEKEYIEKSRLVLHDAQLVMHEEFANIASDILYLTSLSSVQPFVNDHAEPHDIQELVKFVQYKTVFDQVRVIDLSGMERLRINNNNGIAQIVSKDALQSQNQRYVVQEALKLNAGELYLSQLDLNVEHGKIEEPHKPTIRIASPLFDQSGSKRGILVANILFEHIMKKLVLYTPYEMEGLLLANSKGQWLMAPHGEHAWQFMFSDESNQVQRHSRNLWSALQQQSSGLIEDDTGIYAFKQMNSLQLLQQRVAAQSTIPSETLLRGVEDTRLQWWLIEKIPKEEIVKAAWENTAKGLPYFILGVFILILLTAYLLKLFTKVRLYTNELKLAASCFDNADDGMVITDAKSKILKVNSRYETITGYFQKELLGKNPSTIASGWTSNETYTEMWNSVTQTGFWEGEIFDRRKDGDTYAQWLRIIAIKNEEGELTNYLGVTTDITERKRDQERIKELAFRDVLTKLPNRVLFHDRLEHAIASSDRYAQTLALLFIDLDNFKLINDTAGHMIGDKLLSEVAKRFQAIVRDSDTLARLGGDEFVVIVEAAQKSDIVRMSERLLQSLQEIVSIDAIEFFVSASVGIALYPQDASNSQELTRFAETAMYKSKNMGKNQYCFYMADMNAEVSRRLSLENNLKRAIENNEFHIVLQPQIALENRSVVGAEALLRWENRELGFISPSEFIPLVEEMGLIIPITKWVIERSCSVIKEFDSKYTEPISIAVNISSVHVKDKGFVDDIYNIVTGMGVAPHRIELEITEGALITNVEDTVKKLEQLKAYGFKLAIDDFGTGYSSLSYLKKFGFDKLKIDQAFVRYLPEDQEDAGITLAIIAMGRVLGMKLIAEGAETEANVSFLQSHGCEMIQGYYFSKPLHVDDFFLYYESFTCNI